jgi:hypothetical protein
MAWAWPATFSLSSLYEGAAGAVLRTQSAAELFVEQQATKKALALTLYAPTTFILAWYSSAAFHAWIQRMRAGGVYCKTKQLAERHHIGLSLYAVLDILSMVPRPGELVNVSAFFTSVAMAGAFAATGGFKRGGPVGISTTLVSTLLPFAATCSYELALYRASKASSTLLDEMEESAFLASCPKRGDSQATVNPAFQGLKVGEQNSLDDIVPFAAPPLPAASPRDDVSAFQAPMSEAVKSNLTYVAIYSTGAAAIWMYSSWLCLSSCQTNIADVSIGVLSSASKMAKNSLGWDVTSWATKGGVTFEDIQKVSSVWSEGYLKSTTLGMGAFLVNVLFSKVDDEELEAGGHKRTRFIVKLWRKFDV